VAIFYSLLVAVLKKNLFSKKKRRRRLGKWDVVWRNPCRETTTGFVAFIGQSGREGREREREREERREEKRGEFFFFSRVNWSVSIGICCGILRVSGRFFRFLCGCDRVEADKVHGGVRRGGGGW
jgi:hypothetical protein